MNYTIDKNDPKWKDELEAFINCIQSDHISISVDVIPVYYPLPSPPVQYQKISKHIYRINY